MIASIILLAAVTLERLGSGLWRFAWKAPTRLEWLVIFAVFQVARLWTLFTLGRRWATRIIVVPGEVLESPRGFTGLCDIQTRRGGGRDCNTSTLHRIVRPRVTIFSRQRHGPDDPHQSGGRPSCSIGFLTAMNPACRRSTQTPIAGLVCDIRPDQTCGATT